MTDVALRLLPLLLALPGLPAQTWPTYAPTLLVDINPGSQPSSPRDLTVFRDRVWFAANHAQFGGELWVTDGTAQGTQLFFEFGPSTAGGDPDGFCVLGDRMFFAATAVGSGRELWVTDGTVQGTRLFADLVPGPSGSSPHELARIGDRIYFAARDAAGIEPWVTDGTPAGTRRLADLGPGVLGSFPRFFTGYAGQVVFQAVDQGGLGTELFFTDGTSGGTRLLADIDPNGSSMPLEFLAFGGRVYFSAYVPGLGRELWRTDFTTAGTVLFRDLAPGVQSSSPRDLQPTFDGRGFLFVAWRPNHGNDVFATDGSTIDWLWPAGVNMTSVMPTAWPEDLRMVGSRKLYFDGSTPNHQHELHVVELTRPNPFGLFAFDLAPNGDSEPAEFTVLRDLVLFAATGSGIDRELWVMPNGATAAPVDAGCSGSRLDVHDPVLGVDTYYSIDTAVPDAAVLWVLGLPLPAPVLLPAFAPCRIHVDPAAATLILFPARWSGGTFRLPAAPVLHGLTVVNQCILASTTSLGVQELTNAVRLHLGL